MKKHTMVGGGTQMGVSATERRQSVRKRLKAIHATKSKNGGVVFEHHHQHFDQDGRDTYMGGGPETHSFGPAQKAEALHHFAKHMGLGSEMPTVAGEAGGAVDSPPAGEVPKPKRDPMPGKGKA